VKEHAPSCTPSIHSGRRGFATPTPRSSSEGESHKISAPIRKYGLLGASICHLSLNIPENCKILANLVAWMLQASKQCFP
jgi:hypothetical protein